MTTKEFSQEFDTKLNSYDSFNAYGLTIGESIVLNEYEKSIYLTNAQEDLIKEYYSGRNSTRESFEQTEEIKRYLQSLVYDIKLTNQITNTLNGVCSYSQFYQLTSELSANELWYIIFETAKIGNRNTIVKPITHDKVYSILRNPLRTNFLERTYRLDFNDDTIELINKNVITEYFIRYIKRPKPIILEDFETLTINGYSTISQCELHESLHRTILNRAYILALQAYSMTNNKQSNNSSNTDDNNKNNK